MRHLIRIFFFFLAPVVALAQEDVRPDVKRDGLKGNVLKVITINIPDYFHDSNNVKQINFANYTGKRVQAYTQEGWKMYDTMLPPHNPYLRGSDNFQYKTYDYSDGKLSKVTSGDIRGTYETNTNPRKGIDADTQYNYNAQERKAELIITARNSKAVKQPYFSAEGYLATQEPNDAGGKAIWRYYYDQYGHDTLTTFRIVDKNDSMRVYWRNSYTYDAQKNIVEQVSYDWRIQRTGIMKKQIYVYDSKGNWTTRTTFLNNEISETVMRRIEYDMR